MEENKRTFKFKPYPIYDEDVGKYERMTQAIQRKTLRWKDEARRSRLR